MQLFKSTIESILLYMVANNYSDKETIQRKHPAKYPYYKVLYCKLHRTEQSYPEKKVAVSRSRHQRKSKNVHTRLKVTRTTHKT